MFEEEIHQVIVENQLFKPGDRVAIGASGGKGDLLASFSVLKYCVLFALAHDLPTLANYSVSLQILQSLLMCYLN